MNGDRCAENHPLTAVQMIFLVSNLSHACSCAVFFSLVRSNVISSHYVKLYKFIFRYMQHLCIYIYLYISIPLELCIFTEPNWQNNWHFSH